MSRTEQEQKIVLAMIKVYCHKKHHSKHLCPECEALAEYAHKRLTLTLLLYSHIMITP